MFYRVWRHGQYDILQGSMMPTHVRIMNRSMTNCVEVCNEVQQTLHLHILLYVLHCAQQNAYLHMHVPSHHGCDDSWVEIQSKRTIRAENEVEANKLVNNYRVGNTLRRCCEQAPDCECNIEGMEDNSPVLLPSPTEVPVPEWPGRPLRTPYWRRFSTYVWLLLGYPPLVVIHSLACFFSWILVFTIPVSKMNARTLGVILLLAP
ncbi:hypothetical protein D9C73_007378 [Collichthys lucidus]|uniref:Uncharacterized protein n=1 Tax=Collichthys lucidus TaxID=240159 RepID=A0A4U5UGV1_COLLU|nr:hypothetical protein D9C73_007378 [Collichthys lucidus]